MPFAISDRVTLRLKPEATFGVINAVGNHYALRFTSETLKYAIQTVQSAEITGDRQIRDQIIVDGQIQGDAGFEMSYGEQDFLIASALGGVWGNYAGTNGSTGVITATITTQNTVTASAGTPFASIVAGQYVRLSGFVNAGNNKVLKVLTATNTVLTFAGTPLTNEAATATAVVQGARIANGTTLSTFSFERVNNDLTPLYECLRGNTINTLSLDLKVGAILTGSYGVVGKDALAMSASSALPGTTTASLTNTVMNSVTNVSNIQEGGAALTNTFLQNINVKINNNVRRLQGIGVLGAVALNFGEFDAEVSFAGYLADATIYNKFINNTTTSFSFQLSDAAGNAYVVTFPYGKYSDAQRPTGGKNQDILISATFQALKDPVTGVSMYIDRCGAAVTPWA